MVQWPLAKLQFGSIWVNYPFKATVELLFLHLKNKMDMSYTGNHKLATRQKGNSDLSSQINWTDASTFPKSGRKSWDVAHVSTRYCLSCLLCTNPEPDGKGIWRRNMNLLSLSWTRSVHIKLSETLNVLHKCSSFDPLLQQHFVCCVKAENWGLICPFPFLWVNGLHTFSLARHLSATQQLCHGSYCPKEALFRISF